MFDRKQTLHLDYTTQLDDVSRQKCALGLLAWLVEFKKKKKKLSSRFIWAELWNHLVIFCKASPVHSFTGTHLTPCFTRLDCKYDVSQSSVLLCITSKVLNYKTGGSVRQFGFVPKWKWSLVKGLLPWGEPILLARPVIDSFWAGIPSQKQLHFVHNSKPVSRGRPDDSWARLPFTEWIPEVLMREGHGVQQDWQSQYSHLISQNLGLKTIALLLSIA